MAKRRAKTAKRKTRARSRRPTRPAARKLTTPKAARPKAVPAGYHTATPYLTVRGAADAIEFYKRALGATELLRMPSPDGQRVMHAELRIGDSVVMLSDEVEGAGSRSPQAVGSTTGHVHLYVQDVDTAFQRAVAAGAKVQMPLQNMFWGDRYGRITDPFGHEWGLATHKEDLTPKQIAERAAAASPAPA